MQILTWFNTKFEVENTLNLCFEYEEKVRKGQGISCEEEVGNLDQNTLKC